MKTTVLSVAGQLPSTLLTNAQLVEKLAGQGVETSAEWIESRTGITQRYICAQGETTSTLATAAVQKAFAEANLAPSEVDILIVGTCTPDNTFPSTAALIHGNLGMPTHCMALDVNAACSGFIHSLAVAHGLLHSSSATVAVVVGVDTFSNLVDWSDRGTCVLFGDGAGAMVIRKQASAKRGLLGIKWGTDGTMAPALISTGGTATTRTAGTVSMNGREVFKHAVRQMGSAPATLAEAGLTLNDVTWVVPHQANARILAAAAEALGVPISKVVQTVGQHANTSAASIPLALSTAVADGRIKQGHTVLLQAFGAGLAWSEALLIW